MTSPLWPVAGFKAAAMESIHQGVWAWGTGGKLEVLFVTSLKHEKEASGWPKSPFSYLRKINDTFFSFIHNY